MNKCLYILRHAKSDWSNDCSDFNRPINKRGHDAADRMSKFMVEKFITPEVIYASSSVRTSETAAYFQNQFNVAVTSDQGLYLASANRIDTLVKSFSDRLNYAMIIAHNPGIHDFVEQLGNTNLEKYPTCTLSVLETDSDSWSQASHFTLKEFISPKVIP